MAALSKANFPQAPHSPSPGRIEDVLEWMNDPLSQGLAKKWDYCSFGFPTVADANKCAAGLAFPDFSKRRKGYNDAWLLPDLSGFNTPWGYMSTGVGAFGAHVEDLLADSVNTALWNGEGADKIWCVVSPMHLPKLETALQAIIPPRDVDPSFHGPHDPGCVQRPGPLARSH
ncbi:hypothetical protein P7C70_g9268, partial [Phenoliferia sp. Uapishka_3]